MQGTSSRTACGLYSILSILTLTPTYSQLPAEGHVLLRYALVKQIHALGEQHSQMKLGLELPEARPAARPSVNGAEERLPGDFN